MGSTPVVIAAPTHPAHQLVVTWALPFDSALARLGELITRQDLILLASIDTTKVLAAAGLDVPPVRQVLTFHPRYMRTILERDPAAAVEAPVKITVAAEPAPADRPTTTLRLADPGVTFRPYPGLADLGVALHTDALVLLSKPAA
jgi:uncharacterized protein (DUF302 family)